MYRTIFIRFAAVSAAMPSYIRLLLCIIVMLQFSIVPHMHSQVCGTNYAPNTTFPSQAGVCCFDLGVYAVATAITVQASGNTGPQIGSATTSVSGWTAVNETPSIIKYSGPLSSLDCGYFGRQFTFCVTNAYGDVTLTTQFWRNNQVFRTCDTTIHCWDKPCNDIDLQENGPCEWELSFVNTNYGDYTVDGFHLVALSPSGAGITLNTPPPGWNLTAEFASGFMIAPDDPADVIPANGTFSGLTFTTDVSCEPVEFRWETVTSDPGANDSTLCKGTKTISCCECEPGEFSRIDTGPNGDCCYNFEILNENPYLQDVNEIEFNLPDGGIISYANHYMLPPFSDTGSGSTVIFTGGPIPLGTTGSGFVLCFDNLPSTQFTVEYTTYWSDGSLRRPLCTFSQVLTCCGCEGSFASLPATPACECMYELTSLNPKPINKIVLSLPNGTFECPQVVSGLTGWTVNAPGGSTLEFNAPASGSLPACQQGKVSFGITETTLLKYETFFNAEPVCDGKETLICTPPPCDVQWGTLTPDANCQCRYKVSITNPYDVEKIVLESLDAGVEITSVAVLSGNLTTIAGSLPGTLLEFIGGGIGVALPAGTTQEIEFCLSSGGDVRITSYDVNSASGIVICEDQHTYVCNPCSCELEELPVIVLDDCSCAKRIRIKNPEVVSMIVLTATGGQINAVDLGPQFAGWLQTMIPAATVTLEAANLSQALQACTDGFLEICVDQQCTVQIQTFYQNPVLTTPTPVCDWELEIKCAKNCCDPDHWQRSGEIIDKGSTPWMGGNYPPSLRLKIKLHSSLKIGRLSVINERMWITVPGHSTQGMQDLTGYFWKAQGHSSSPVVTLFGFSPWASPIVGSGSSSLADLNTYAAAVGGPPLTLGNPREISWNNISQTGADCSDDPLWLCNISSGSELRTWIAWRPAETPVIPMMWVHVKLRIEFTNEDCITCWDIVEDSVLVHNSTSTPSGPVDADLSMNSGSSGSLTVSLASMAAWPDGTQITSLTLTPDPQLTILDMIQEATGMHATISDSSAVLDVSIPKGHSADFALTYDNPLSLLRVNNTISVQGTMPIPGETTAVDTWAVSLPLIGLVPLAGGAVQDTVLAAESECANAHTFHLQIIGRQGESAAPTSLILSPRSNHRFITAGYSPDATSGLTERQLVRNMDAVVFLPDTAQWRPDQGAGQQGTPEAGVFLTTCGEGEVVEIHLIELTAEGDTAASFDFTLTDPVTTGVAPGAEAWLPKPDVAFALSSVYPNPAVSRAAAVLQVNGRDRRITLTVHDASGREVLRVIDQQHYNPGTHVVLADVGRLPAGMYRLVAASGGMVISRPMLILR